MQNYQRNIQQVEVGLAMLGNDLSAEYYLIPTKGGALEHSLALRQDDRSALEYAGYLPTNMAYCSASGPMLDGMPGAARVVLDLATGIFGMFLPPEQSNGFGKSMEALMAQCSQGRAIGLTAPPVNTPGQPTFVGIYHVSGAQDARAIVHDFLAQVQKVRTSLFGGALTQVFSLEYKPGVETLAATPVDIVTITITSNAPPAKAKAGDGKGTPAAGGMRVDCRLAYVNDKMLFTVGEDGKGQMAAFLDRVKNQKPGFTTSARFQVLKASLPEKVHGFEMFASLDLARAAVNIFAQGNDRTTGLKWLSIFPPQHSPIITYQEMQPDNIRGELRLPAEQMTFFYTLVKAAVEMQQNTAK